MRVTLESPGILETVSHTQGRCGGVSDWTAGILACNVAASAASTFYGSTRPGNSCRPDTWADLKSLPFLLDQLTVDAASPRYRQDACAPVAPADTGDSLTQLSPIPP